MSTAKWKPLSVGCAGANVEYFGHRGWFTADIVRVGTHCVIAAGGPVAPGKLVRGRNDEVTHQLSEYGPMTGKGYDGTVYFSPEKGIFVVPIGHVKVKNEENGK